MAELHPQERRRLDCQPVIGCIRLHLLCQLPWRFKALVTHPETIESLQSRSHPGGNSAP